MLHLLCEDTGAHGVWLADNNDDGPGFCFGNLDYPVSGYSPSGNDPAHGKACNGILSIYCPFPSALTGTIWFSAVFENSNSPQFGDVSVGMHWLDLELRFGVDGASSADQRLFIRVGQDPLALDFFGPLIGAGPFGDHRHLMIAKLEVDYDALNHDRLTLWSDPPDLLSGESGMGTPDIIADEMDMIQSWRHLVLDLNAGNRIDAIRVSYDGITAASLSDVLRPSAICGDGVLDVAEECDDGNTLDGDCCNSTCGLEADGSVCDDGEFCTQPDTCSSGSCTGVVPSGSECLTATVVAGQFLTTDTEGDGATPTDPVETTISTPVAGDLGILEVPTVFGVLVELMAPMSSAQAPLSIVYRFDASLGLALNAQVAKDGRLVPPCANGVGEALPDPCVSTRTILADSDLEVTVLSSSASTWSLAPDASCQPGPFVGCSDAQSAKVRLKNAGPKAKLTWRWRSATDVEIVDLANPSAETRYSLCVFDRVDSTPSGAFALGLAPGPRWQVSASGRWRYRDADGEEDGVGKVSLRPGPAGKAKLAIKAKGDNLPLSSPVSATAFFHSEPGVVLQLVNSSGRCWAGDFQAAKRNTPA